ncbi:MAG: class I SAM-dependent DNA methyltransferase [Myxococcota bacterium]
MKGYEPVASFDAESARRHDHRGDESEAVAFLAELAGPGPALELAIGTGRIALPLAARGVRVDGIDLSPAMLERLRSKPGGDALSVHLGNFADVDVPGHYALIFVVWNTLFNLLTQEEQIRCFQNVAAHLTPDGAFVVEAYVPSFLHALRDQQRVDVEAIEVDEVRVGVMRHDAARQSIEQSHVSLSGAGIRLTPVVQRYAWPSELDLMARLAGLQLRERSADWTREPFTSDSRAHVSVYGR